MLYCIFSVPHLRVSKWYLILLVALSDKIRGTDGLFLFKCGLAFKAGLRHLSWNNLGGSATIPVGQELTRISLTPTGITHSCRYTGNSRWFMADGSYWSGFS
jgi:hypothetical protein